MTNVMIGTNVTSIGDHSFFGCDMTGITMGNNITTIGDYAFEYCLNLPSITMPSSVTSIGDYAFGYCYSLAFYFQGNAPIADPTVFQNDETIIYYVQGTTGWGASYCGVPTWNPQIQTGSQNFGTSTNSFGFNIDGNNNLTFIVEVCTNLTNPIWTPVATNTTSSGSAYFSDPQWTNYPGRFYRLRSP